MSVVPLEELLDKYVKSRFVHYATIDLEGFEFPVMDAFRAGGVHTSYPPLFWPINASHQVNNMAKVMSSAHTESSYLLARNILAMYVTTASQ